MKPAVTCCAEIVDVLQPAGRQQRSGDSASGRRARRDFVAVLIIAEGLHPDGRLDCRGAAVGASSRAFAPAQIGCITSSGKSDGTPAADGWHAPLMRRVPAGHSSSPRARTALTVEFRHLVGYCSRRRGDRSGCAAAEPKIRRRQTWWDQTTSRGLLRQAALRRTWRRRGNVDEGHRGIRTRRTGARSFARWPAPASGATAKRAKRYRKRQAAP
jgi:hypothetical protein